MAGNQDTTAVGLVLGWSGELWGFMCVREVRERREESRESERGSEGGMEREREKGKVKGRERDGKTENEMKRGGEEGEGEE